MLSPDGETDLCDILMGVLQGDTLTPFLFVIVLDYAMRKAIDGKEEALGFTITPRRIRHIPARMITDLDFADDIALMSNLMIQSQELLLAGEEECNRVGLKINAKKTKYLSYNINDDFDTENIIGQIENLVNKRDELKCRHLINQGETIVSCSHCSATIYLTNIVDVSFI